MTEMTAFDAVSHAFGALGEYKEDEEIHAFLDALPEGWELMATKHDWWPTARAEGAQQERERLRNKAFPGRNIAQKFASVDRAFFDDPDEADR